jgi:hypothetical protein
MRREALVGICGGAFPKVGTIFLVISYFNGNSSIPSIFSLHLAGISSLLGAMNFGMNFILFMATVKLFDTLICRVIFNQGGDTWIINKRDFCFKSVTLSKPKKFYYSRRLFTSQSGVKVRGKRNS